MVESLMPANLGDNVSVKEGYTFSLAFGEAMDTLVSIYRMKEKNRSGKWPLVIISESGDTLCIDLNSLGFPVISDMHIHSAIDLTTLNWFKKRYRIDVVNMANDLRYKLRLPPVFILPPGSVGLALKDYETKVFVYTTPPETYTGDLTRYKIAECFWDGKELQFNGQTLFDLDTKIYHSSYSKYNNLHIWIKRENLINFEEEVK